jgi:hypothetical protein
MADPNSSGQKYQLLSAAYNSPTNAPFTAIHKLSTPPSSKTEDRTSYLSTLRKATSELQETINKELTQRMEEDKAREVATSNGNGTKARGVDEAAEEDNYGEEVAEEEE